MTATFASLHRTILPYGESEVVPAYGWVPLFRVVIPGEPGHWSRAAGRNKRGKIVNHPKTEAAKRAVRGPMEAAMKAHGVEFSPIGTPMAVGVVAVYKRGDSKPAHVPAYHFERWPYTSTPDADNTAKLPLDAAPKPPKGARKWGAEAYLRAAKSCLWHDDAQVTTLRVEQWYGARGEAPHVVLEVARWEAVAKGAA